MISVSLKLGVDSKHRNVGFTTGSVVRTPFVLPLSATGRSHLGNLALKSKALTIILTHSLITAALWLETPSAGV